MKLTGAAPLADRRQSLLRSRSEHGQQHFCGPSDCPEFRRDTRFASMQLDSSDGSASGMDRACLWLGINAANLWQV